MNKQFIIFWHADSYGADAWCKEVDLDFFTLEHGFDEADIKAVNNLDIGEMYNGNSMADDVRIIRLKGETHD